MRFTKLFPSVKCLYRRLNYGKVFSRNYSAGAGSGGAEQKGVVVCVYENKNKFELSPVGQEVDQKCGGLISQQLNTLCELKLGKAFAVTNILDYSAVAISCIGSKEASYNALESLDEARENIRWGVGAGVKLLRERGCLSITVDPVTAPDAAAEAAELSAWTFEMFKSVKVSKSTCQVSMYGSEGLQLWQEGSIRAKAQNWARCLSDMPANKMTPVDLAQAALDCLCPLGIVVQAYDREWIEAQRMRAFLAVAKGSCDTPMFLECCYKGASPDLPPVLLAAKGVTFDSGGLCLKECQSMTENRGSMAGAAVVLATLEIIAKLKVPINVSAVIPICENMVSGQCMKVGDVVQALNGLSIQIENTDMEGRLMMADALVYGQSIYKPALVIDVATFTHGVLMATGGGAFGCFSNSEAAWRALRCAGACSGDRAWRFPLWQYFLNQITNDPSVDLRNKGSGQATPCLGAAFLKNFICGDWIHMDITGVGKVAHCGAPPYLDTHRMTGRPTRTLAILLQQIATASKVEPCEPSQKDISPCAPSQQVILPCGPSQQSIPPCGPSQQDKPPCGPLQQGIPPCGPSQQSIPPCEPSKQVKPPCGPYQQGIPPCGPSQKGIPSCGPLQQGIPPCGPSPKGNGAKSWICRHSTQGKGPKTSPCQPCGPPQGSPPCAPPSQTCPTSPSGSNPTGSNTTCTPSPPTCASICARTKHKCR